MMTVEYFHAAMHKFLAFFALLAWAQAAPALTINFEDGTYAFPVTGHTYTESGFVFSAPVRNHFDSNDAPGNVVFPGGLPHLVFHESANNAVNNLITLTSTGAAFDLISFDLVFNQAVKNRNPAINPIMTILGSGGQSLQTPSNGFLGTVSTPAFTGVNFVTFDINRNSTAAGNVILDNVVVRPASLGAVPLPASGLLLIFGLGALALLWQIFIWAFFDELFTVRASYWWGFRECVKDGLPDGWHGRLRGWSGDSFFPVPRP